MATTVGTPDDRQPLRIWHPDERQAAIGESGESHELPMLPIGKVDKKAIQALAAD